MSESEVKLTSAEQAFMRDLKEAAYLLDIRGISRGHPSWQQRMDCLKQRLREHLNAA